MTITLTDEQQRAADQVSEWLESRGRRAPNKSGRSNKYITLGGLAGVGKTTLISHLIERHEAAVCAFTGKAAFVLRSKGVDASTMHRLMYKPVERAGGEVEFVKVKRLGTRFVIVDESSMVNRDLMSDLLSFDVMVLFVGDHGQLEPVGDDPGLMKSPDIKLETIHRQAAGSPIIVASHAFRESKRPADMQQTTDRLVVRRGPATTSELLDHDMVICGYNNTRKMINNAVRKSRGFSGPLPMVGERVVCLRNNRKHGVFNGMLGTVVGCRVRHGTTMLHIVDDVGNETELAVEPQQFQAPKTLKDVDYKLGLFDFGYALTAHKSQGSEWNNVMVLEQIASSWGAGRWRYTAATRAADRLTYAYAGRR